MSNKYKYKKNSDGSFTIFSVPIFGLGEHRGFNYDKIWAKGLIERHSELQNTGYSPVIILGHNGYFDFTEKESVGFVQNVCEKDSVIYADLLINSEESFNQVIASKKYPYRSVEVHKEAGRLSALALLGGSEPYFKFPALIPNSIEEYDYCDYQDEAFEYEEDAPEHFSSVPDNKFKAFISYVYNMFQKDQPPSSPQEDFKGEDMDRNAFIAKFGMTPEEAAEAKKNQESFLNQQKELAKTKAESFKTSLAAKNVAPAVIEIIGKSAFAADDAFIELVNNLVNYAKEGTLIVPSQDNIPDKPAGSGSYKDMDEKQIYAEAHKLVGVGEGKFASYNEACEYLFNISKSK